jgi:hypothetical protein
MTSTEKFIEAIILSCLLCIIKITVNNSDSLLQLKKINYIFNSPPTTFEKAVLLTREF